MSFQAYLQSIEKKTGKTPADFRVLANAGNLTKFGDVVAWLKADFGLGHGHANAMAHVLVNPDKFKASPDDKFTKLFSGAKAKWEAATRALTAKIASFGSDVTIAANQTYVNLQKGKRKFGLIQPGRDRLDIGLKLPGADAPPPYEAAGNWNAMVTHRLRIERESQIDQRLLADLKRAYDRA